MGTELGMEEPPMYIKRIVNRIVVLGIMTHLLAACAGQPQSLVRNLQDVQIEGGVPANAIHIVDKREAGKAEITPYLRINQDRTSSALLEGHTLVNSSGEFEIVEIAPGRFVETAGTNTMPYEGNNLRWQQPKYQFGLDIVVPLTNDLGFTVAVENSQSEDFSSLSYGIGGNIAIEERYWGAEIHGMLRAQEFNYRAEVVEVEDKQIAGNETREVYFIELDSRSLYINRSMSLTINSKHPNWIFQPFGQIEIGSQDLTKIEEDLSQPRFNSRISSAEGLEQRGGYLSVAGGFYINLESNQRILVGMRRRSFNQVENFEPIVDGFIQFTYTLGTD